MKRTVKDAEGWLEGNAEALNPAVYHKYSQEVAAAKQSHINRANEQITAEVETFTVEHHQVLRDGCSVRDEYEALAKEAATGRLSAAEYRERLNRLDGEFELHLKGRAERLGKRVSAVEAIEGDPVEYIDSLHSRLPALHRPDFSF